MTFLSRTNPHDTNSDAYANRHAYTYTDPDAHANRHSHSYTDLDDYP